MPVASSWISSPPATAIPSGTECCPINWLEHDGSCYWFSRSGLTWPEAQKFCQLENAHLVVINSREEQVNRTLPKGRRQPLECKLWEAGSGLLYYFFNLEKNPEAEVWQNSGRLRAEQPWILRGGR